MMEIEDIHIPFLAWLHELEIPVVYHRPDRKSGIQTGWPDFSVAWMGRVVFIEAKTPEGRLSKVQENVHAFIRKSGNRIEICRSVEECKEAVRNILCEKLPGNGTEDRSESDEKLRTGGWCESQGVPHEFDICTGPPDDSRLGKYICNFCGELETVLSGGAESGVSAPDPIITGPKDGARRSAAQNFYIGDWKGQAYVFAPDQDGAYRMIRQASVIDIANLPKLP